MQRYETKNERLQTDLTLANLKLGQEEHKVEELETELKEAKEENAIYDNIITNIFDALGEVPTKQPKLKDLLKPLICPNTGEEL